MTYLLHIFLDDDMMEDIETSATLNVPVDPAGRAGFPPNTMA